MTTSDNGLEVDELTGRVRSPVLSGHDHHYGTGEDRIVDDLSSQRWDEALSALGGHPLQSSIWGDARAFLGIRDLRLARVSPTGVVTWMIRVEQRHIPFLGLAGWAPKGPTQISNTKLNWSLDPLPRRALIEHGLHFLVTDPYVEAGLEDDRKPRRPRTIWIDLSRGKDVLFADLEKKWRNGVRRAEKEGVRVKESTADGDISAFVKLCSNISVLKGFRLDLSAQFVSGLLARRTEFTRVRLFTARRGSVLLAAALVFISGRHWHYFWGGTDREAGNARAGEAVQWAIIETAIAEGAIRYDLEGIDDIGNAGTAAFKRKMGGREVELIGHVAHPLDARGRLLAAAYRLFR